MSGFFGRIFSQLFNQEMVKALARTPLFRYMAQRSVRRMDNAKSLLEDGPEAWKDVAAETARAARRRAAEAKLRREQAAREKPQGFFGHLLDEVKRDFRGKH